MSVNADENLNRFYIESAINESENKNELRGVFSDHFDNLTHPVSVSLGVYFGQHKIDEIVRMLRQKGVDAVPCYAPEVKENLSCFVVDGTGIRSPILNPEDAIKATADIFEIMKQNGVLTSRALPVSQGSFIPAAAKVYDNKIIDIQGNNPDEPDVDKFLSDQINYAVNNMEQVDPAANEIDGKKYLYRGGTLGDKPYGIAFHQRKRDTAYAAKDFDTAVTYADGFKGIGFRYKKIDNHSYGFVYKFEESMGQRYYGMAGIENPRGSEECIGHPDNRDDYETLILPDRNQLAAVYLKVDDKVVQIADEKGWLSKEWEKFAELHTPYNVNEQNDYMVKRINKQIADFKPVPYAKIKNDDREFDLDFCGLFYKNCIRNNPEAKAVDEYRVSNARILSVKLPKDLENIKFEGDFFLDNCSTQPETKMLDLSECSGIVGISAGDLSNMDKIVLPKQCELFFLSDSKFPAGEVLDLSKIQCKQMVFEDQDFSNFSEVKFPENTKIKFKGNIVLPDKKNAS